MLANIKHDLYTEYPLKVQSKYKGKNISIYLFCHIIFICALSGGFYDWMRWILCISLSHLISDTFILVNSHAAPGVLSEVRESTLLLKYLEDFNAIWSVQLKPQQCFEWQSVRVSSVSHVQSCGWEGDGGLLSFSSRTYVCVCVCLISMVMALSEWLCPWWGSVQRKYLFSIFPSRCQWHTQNHFHQNTSQDLKEKFTSKHHIISKHMLTAQEGPWETGRDTEQTLF